MGGIAVDRQSSEYARVGRSNQVARENVGVGVDAEQRRVGLQNFVS